MEAEFLPVTTYHEHDSRRARRQVTPAERADRRAASAATVSVGFQEGAHAGAAIIGEGEMLHIERRAMSGISRRLWAGPLLRGLQPAPPVTRDSRGRPRGPEREITRGPTGRSPFHRSCLPGTARSRQQFPAIVFQQIDQHHDTAERRCRLPDQRRTAALPEGTSRSVVPRSDAAESHGAIQIGHSRNRGGTARPSLRSGAASVEPEGSNDKGCRRTDQVIVTPETTPASSSDSAAGRHRELMAPRTRGLAVDAPGAGRFKKAARRRVLRSTKTASESHS